MRNIFYSALRAEIWRSAKTINGATIFQWNSRILINQNMKQRVKINRLLNTPISLFRRHFDVFCKRNNISPEYFKLFLK